MLGICAGARLPIMPRPAQVRTYDHGFVVTNTIPDLRAAPPVVWSSGRRGPLLRVPVRQAPPSVETRRAQNTKANLFEDEDEDEGEGEGEVDLEMETEETPHALFCSVLFCPELFADVKTQCAP